MAKGLRVSEHDAKTPVHAAIIRAVTAAKGYAGLASALNQRDPKMKISNQRVYNWVNRDYKAPAELVLSIEAVTGVNRSSLRPDIYPTNQPQGGLNNGR